MLAMYLVGEELRSRTRPLIYPLPAPIGRQGPAERGVAEQARALT